MAEPVININTANAKGMTNLDLANGVTNWNGFKISGGATPSAVQEQDVFIQGTAAVSTKLSGAGTDKGLYFDNGSGIDMTVTGRHFYIWVAVTTVAATDTIENNGIYVMMSTAGGGTPTEYISFNVGGSNFTEDAGFRRYCIDANKIPSRSAGSTTLTSIQHFGAGITMTGTAKSENLVIDRIDYGDGLQIERGQAGNAAAYEKLFLADDNVSNKYGIITKEDGVYYALGGLTLGDPTASGFETFWDERSNSTLQFRNPLYYNGTAIVSSIDAANLYNIIPTGNDTGQTDIKWGEVVGSGDDRQGINGGTIGSAGPKWTLDGETDIADITTMNLYGLNCLGAGTINVTNSTKGNVIGCSFAACDQVEPNSAEFLNNFIVAPVPKRGLEMVTGHNTKQTTFVGAADDEIGAVRCWQVDESATPDTFVEMTVEFNDGIANNCIPFPATEAVNDYFCIGMDEEFRKVRINTGTAGAGGTPAVTLEYWNGSSWSALDNVSDGTNAFTTAGLQTVTWDTPINWASTSLNGERPLRYMRFRLTSVYTTTNPLISIGVTGFKQTKLLHFPAGGTFSLEAMKFFGTAAVVTDLENSDDATVTDNYAFSNQDSVYAFGGGTHANEAISQSITGDGGVLSRVIFQLRTNGSPTGTFTAQLYAHSGTFGTSSVPTGAALATSNLVNVSLLTPTLAEIEIEFEDKVTLVNTTKYCMTVFYTTGSSSNFIEAGRDSSAPSHGGNGASKLTGGAWIAQAGIDCVFAVHTDAIVTAQASEGGNPTTEVHTSATANGATIIENTVALEVNGVTEGARCSILARGISGPEVEGALLLDGYADSTGKATSQYDFSTAQDITVLARFRGQLAAAIQEDADSTDTDFTSEARDRATAADVIMFPTVEGASDAFYFGGIEPFEKITVSVATAAAGGATFVWEVWTGSWVTLAVVDGTSDFTNTGWRTVTFTAPGGWVTTTVNGQGPFYYTRFRYVSGTISTTPVLDYFEFDAPMYRGYEADKTITGVFTDTAIWQLDPQGG